MTKEYRRCPLFITLEGGEGAGKTTLISRLQGMLVSQHYSVVVTREPGSTALGEQIRNLLLHHAKQITINGEAELLLFLAARSQHIDEVIRPSLEEGKVVICDRYNDSTIAYQGFARGLDFSKVMHWCNEVCNGVFPEVTLFLDVDPAVAKERTIKQGRTADRMESEESDFHQKVRQGFLKIADMYPERVHVIDASQNSDDVYHAAVSIIKKKLPQES